ncbi:MAG TPA: DUF4105 domain-containing protein [Gemmatimonadaceae bacterium]|nr:DUF4105 domain-containing protein [Gemmatimonadaceae bacterium]
MLLVLAAGPLAAQASVPGSELTVYLVTMGPGIKVWERFGHNAIWIQDRSRNVGVAYNWGLFSFDEPGFLRRFLLGHMDYWMGGFDAGSMIGAYMQDNRSVWAQELRLTAAQKLALRDFVEWNARPENRTYRYDYFRDNCSTRVRDAIDRVLGARIRSATDTVPSRTTYRWHTRRLLTEDLPMYAGTLYGLGRPTDGPITVWEEMFLPMRLREHVRGIAVPDESGRLVPLVASERQLFASTGVEEPVAPPRYLWLFLTFGLLVGAGLAWMGTRARSRLWRGSFASAGTVWCVVSGVLGTGLMLAWLFTDHVYTYWNENILQLGPLALPLIVMLPRAALGGGSPRAVRALTASIAALSVLGFALQLLPGFSQVNGELIALALPVNLGLALGAWGVTRGAATSSPSA